MDAACLVIRLHGLPPDRFAALIAESEAAGFAFMRRLVDEWDEGANRFDRPGEALFAAVVAGRIVGVCGLNVDPYGEGDRVGRVRHLYVACASRRRGIGRRLVTAVVAEARGAFGRLRLRTGDASAARFYETLGFRSCDDAACTHALDLLD